MTDGTWMGTTPSSGLKGPSRALLFIIAVSRWGPWYADPYNKYPRFPRVYTTPGQRPDPLRWLPGAAFLFTIIGIGLMAMGEVPVIPCGPIVSVVTAIGIVAFIVKSKRSSHHWEKPPPHHLKKKERRY